MNLMTQIRNAALTEEFDYLFLLNCLSSYKQPRDKITKLLKNEDIIRVKKGLYVFGPAYQKRPYSLGVLANLIYGPSYLSFESALSFHGLIPESVTRLTSAVFKKNKKFETPVGDFVYTTISKESYPLGLLNESVDSAANFFIASKEKALCDYLTQIKPFISKQDLLEYLIEGMRIEEEELFKLCPSLIEEIACLTLNQNIKLLCLALKK